MPTLLGELDANRGSAEPHSPNYDDEASSVVHHVTGLAPCAFSLSREAEVPSTGTVISSSRSLGKVACSSRRPPRASMYPASVERSMSLPETPPREEAASSLEIAGWLTLEPRPARPESIRAPYGALRARSRPIRNVRDTWLSQQWREISGGFAAKLTLSSRAAFRGNRPRPYPLRSKRRGRTPALPPPRPLSRAGVLEGVTAGAAVLSCWV